MNYWLKVAIYSFAAIIIGSFMLGILGSVNGMPAQRTGGWNMSGQPAVGYQGGQPYWMSNGQRGCR